MALLIDVSNNQGTIDWDQVKAARIKCPAYNPDQPDAEYAIDGAIIKAVQGTYFIDDQFARNWSEAKRIGLARGAYCFADPARDNASDTRAYFLRVVAPVLEVGDVVALDLEWPTDTSMGAAQLSPFALEFLAETTKDAGVEKCLDYTYPWYAQVNQVDPALAAYPLWLASYGNACPTHCSVWGSVTLWQQTWEAVVPGISGTVDLNIYYPPISHLKAFGKPAPVAPHPRFEVLTDTHMRVSPAKPAAYDKVAELKKGQIIDGTGQLTASWRQCTVDGVTGWVILQDLKSV
jgi:GH25 family lysozyme M1 (1,4-beta-N-acetylmuramidase)